MLFRSLSHQPGKPRLLFYVHPLSCLVISYYRPRLSRDNPEQLFSVLPAPLGAALEDLCEPKEKETRSFKGCPHELWLELNTNDTTWASYSKFTLRISWPASVGIRYSV